MNKTKEELGDEIDIWFENHEKEPTRYTDPCKYLDGICMDTRTNKQIYHNCVKNKCPNYDVIEIGFRNFAICYDDWSFAKNGWHLIYCETMDLCVENKLTKR